MKNLEQHECPAGLQCSWCGKDMSSLAKTHNETLRRLREMRKYIDKVVDALENWRDNGEPIPPALATTPEDEERKRMMLDDTPAPAQSTPRDTEPAPVNRNAQVMKPKEYPPPSDYVVMLGECMCHLASVCDGAHDEDGVGFNGRDTDIGHNLADWWTKNKFYTKKQQSIAEAMVRRYRKQLIGAGYDLSHLT